MNKEITKIELIKTQLKELYRKNLMRKGSEGIIILVGIVFLVNLFLSLLEIAGLNSSLNRIILFYSGIIIIGSFFVWIVFLPLLRIFFHVSDYEILSLTKLIGTTFKEIKDELQNAVELDREKSKGIFSEELIEANIHSVYSKFCKLNLNNCIDYSRLKNLTKLVTGFVVINILLFITIPQLGWATFRIINYQKEFALAPDIMFEISPGDTVITKGTGLKIRISVYGDIPDLIDLQTKFEGSTKYSSRRIFRNKDGYFILKFEKVRTPFDYKIKVGKFSSRRYTIKVIDRPIITSLRIKISPPPYSKVSESEQIDNGNISSLKGSLILLSLKSSKSLMSAKIIFDDSSSSTLKIDDLNASTIFKLSKSCSYKIILKDKFGVNNINPITYSINVIEDSYPSIELEKPFQDVQLGNDNTVPILTAIKDDYGFSKLLLKYKLISSQFEDPWIEEKYRELPINIEETDQQVGFNWNMAELNPTVNEVYAFYLEIYDNDKVSGPKSVKSKTITIRIPSLDELFKEGDKKQEEISNNLEETLKEANKLKEEIKKISNDLKRDKKEITWNEKEKIQKSIEKFQQIQNKIDDVQKQLSEMKKDVQENKLLSNETLEKYQELQNLMDELTDEDLKNAFKKLEDALKSMNRNDTQKALDEMKFDEETFQKSLERTINLLKRIQIEQKLDELVKRTENISKELEELAKSTELGKSDSDKLAKKQNELTKQIQKFNEEAEKLSEKMNEFKDMPKDEMEKLNEEMDEQSNEEKSENAEKQLQKNNRQQASQMQKQMLSNMKQNMKKLSQIQSSMQMQNQMSTMMEMMKALNGLISLSKEQESIRQKNQSGNSSAFNESVKSQNQLKNNLDKVINQLSELSQKSFAITPEMGKALGKAKINMQQAIQNIQSKNVSSVLKSQQESMKYLNESASLLKSGMEQMMQSGGQGGGMMSLMQQMEKLSQQQMGLNQITQQLNQGQLTEGQQGELQRLAQQQEMIRKSLDEMNKEAKESGQSKRLAANLEDILKEMKEVVENLQSEKINDDVIKSQDKILSRMLDAQRSVNERDYEKKRESAEGKTFSRKSPGELSDTEKKTKIQEELQKAIREGYKKDYENLIRRYYESLEKNKKQ